ncbi:hypothetical protein [Paraburkholderia sp. GAS32]|uniref:hypothetical protein n=1 Tax=Paraburkholderia sp. GAS32 TaxID=3035129 RepID=UPI003D221F36
MPFLAISCFLMYANLIAAFRYTVREGEQSRLLGAGHMLACAVSAFAFLFGVELLIFDRDGGISGNAYNWTPLAYLVFGVLSLILFAIKLYRKARDPGKGGIGIVFGMTLWAVMASLYISATTVDHFLFFRDREHTGLIAADFSGENLTCSGGMVLVRFEGETAIYRCPQSVSFGRDYGEPFVPWPSYIEGSSATMKGRIDALLSQAQKPGIVSVPSGDLKVMPHARDGKTGD